MTKPFRPMLACNEVITDYDALTYPLIASAKLDGWRSYNRDGQPYTRSGKPIPNTYTRAVLSIPELEGLDGELICGDPTDRNAMQKAQSAFSTHDGAPDFTWFIFDDWRRDQDGYWEWWRDRVVNDITKFPSFCKLLPQVYVTSAVELENFSYETLKAGYEGLITRTPGSPYKQNRSTRRQEWMLKIKPHTYEEAMIVDFNEKMINFNKPTTSELGFIKRSGHQRNKVPANTLGSFVLRSSKYPETFGVGCGPLTDEQKQKIWNNRSNHIGDLVTFRHFAQTGTVTVPRQGQFVAFRALEDLA